jgi:DNA polymerase-3 subunit delta
LYVLWGPDDFSLEQALDRIKARVGDREALATNLTVLNGPEATADRLRSICEAAPFLAERRLVVVEGLLARFQSSGRPARSSRARKKETATTEAGPLADYMSTIPESTDLVLVDTEVTGSNPLLALISSRAEVRSFPLLKPADLKQWLQGRIRDGGGSMSPRASELLTRLVGSNLRVLDSEAAKLLLYAGDRQIEEDDVRLLVGYTQQTNVFALVDAIVEFRSGPAERLLHQMLQQGATPGYLMSMLTRQVRLMVLARDVGRPRMSAAELRGRLGLASEFVARKAQEQAARYTMPRLKQVYERLLDADLAIKTGQMDAELALTVLVAELCQSMPARAAHG